MTDGVGVRVGVGVTVEDGVGVTVGVVVGVLVTVCDGVGVLVGVTEGVGVGVLVGIGVNGYVSSSKNVINLYCAEVKLFLVSVIPYDTTVLTSFGLSISLLRMKRL